MKKQNAIMLTNKSNMLPLKRNLKIIPITLYLCCAAILKSFYSHATPGDLQWILLPTALIVEMFTGIHFAYNALEGYCSIDHETIIAPACAGVNFMIIILCLTTSLACKYKQIRRVHEFVLYLIAILIISYCATLFFNTIRIIMAIGFYNAGIEWGYFTQERIHRLIGIVIYFAGACFVYSMAGKFLNQTASLLKIKRMNYGLYVIPLIWYVTIMVVIPLMLGKQNQKCQLFIEHIVFVIGVPLLITGLLVSSKKFIKHWRINI
jgi:exosortase K